MKLSHSPDMARKKLQCQGVPDSSRQSFYSFVIRMVSGALMIAGTASNVFGQSQTDSKVVAANSGAVGNSSTTDMSTPTPSDRSSANNAPQVYKNEVGATVDFMLGKGTVTLPIGYALAKALPGGGLNPAVISGDRSTVYYGSTISYSYGRSWYLDLSYEKGASSGSQTVDFQNTVQGLTSGSFNYDDAWYQLYLRYNFKDLLQGTKFKAYLRGGVSLVEAKLKINDVGGLYQQSNDTSDILGNIGFGLTYSLYARPRFRVGLQVEGEGFYGARSQKSTEILPLDYGMGELHASIDNDLYGAIGRGTIHADFRLGQSGRWRLTADAGVQYKYTMITYPGNNGLNELLWGPYAKVGISYVF
jgi:hypothetical protein